MWVARHARAEQEGRDDDAAAAKRKVGEIDQELAAEKRLAEHWASAPKPVPFPELPAAPKWDDTMSPTAWKDWATDSAYRAQVPAEAVVASGLMAAAITVGRQLGIRPKREDEWTVVPNTFGALVGVPSKRKSAAQDEGFAFLRGIQADSIDIWKQGELERIAAKAAYTEVKRNVEKEAKSSRPSEVKESLDADFDTAKKDWEALEHPKRWYSADTTVAALTVLMQNNPNGVAIVRDELGGLFKAMQQPGHETDREFFKEMWNGDKDLSTDRVNPDRGHTQVRHACGSIYGTIQPGPLEAYVRQAAKVGQSGSGGADGFLHRFQMLVYPEWFTPKYVDKEPDREAREAVREGFRRLAELNLEEVGAEHPVDDGLPFVRFSPEAQLLYIDWYNLLQERVGSGEMHPMMEAHLSKYPSLMPTLALLFQLIDEGEGPAGTGATELAIRWCDFLEKHAERVFADAITPEIAAAKRLLKKVKTGKVPNPFEPRDIYRSCWTGLKQQDVEGAIESLEDFGYAHVERGKTGRGGKATKVYLHPSTQPASGSILSVLSVGGKAT
jgi:putative DNA primase/helicase